jgi:hypothetical protein
MQKSLIDERDPLSAVNDEYSLDHTRENATQAEIFIGDLAVELKE